MPEDDHSSSRLDSLSGSDFGRIPPFLRWAGGKRWLVPEVYRLLGGGKVARYHEPFLGGGAVFFALDISEKAYLSDLNGDLVETFTEVRDNPRPIARLLRQYENTAECYYSARESAPLHPTERAARFIYLNHTSFNGIFRVNLKGQYNVPFGNRKYVNMPDITLLLEASRRLQRAQLESMDFGATLTRVRRGDIVFLDPPYTVAHNNNGFVKYNDKLFEFSDQVRLAEALQDIRDRGANFILTNAAHLSIDELFGGIGRRITVSRRNSVGGKRAGRGRAEEFVFTNLKER